MTSAEFVQILMNGLVLASIYVLVASGFALVYSIMRIVNFAHGEIYMMGAFALFYLFSQWGINYFFALILSMLLLAVLGFMIERVLFFRLQTAHLSQVIASLG